MKFTYRYYSIELLILGIEYPSYPNLKKSRAVTIWQISIDGKEPRIKKGTKKEIIDQVKKYIRQIDGDEFSCPEDEDDFEYEDNIEDEIID
jgi:hypothetical protein